MEIIEAVLLRVYLTEGMKWRHKPLYEAIVMLARERELAGATVLRGPMSFGRTTQMHTAKILDLSMNLPMVVEIVESETRITSFLAELEPMITGGLVTTEKVKVVRMGSGVTT